MEIILIFAALAAVQIAVTLYIARCNGMQITYKHHPEPRKWRGYWKLHPEMYPAIVADTRTHAEIAKSYNVSRSMIGKIKKDYGGK